MNDGVSSTLLRVDMYLKRSRLVKRRSLAATLCENGFVTLNGRPAPPGKSVRRGDRIEVTYARKKVLVEVMEIPETPKRDQECYRVIREEKIEDELF
jgi:ribosomal 50S subunit-recycling heat shock protein